MLSNFPFGILKEELQEFEYFLRYQLYLPGIHNLTKFKEIEAFVGLVFNGLISTVIRTDLYKICYWFSYTQNKVALPKK